MNAIVSAVLTFCQVVEEGSFVRAAQTIGVSKAAISQAISGLEKKLSVQLLQRTTRTIKMTDAGAVLYEQAQSLKAELSELEAVVRSFGEEPVGKLHVVCGRHFGNRYLVPRLKDFCDRYPKLVVSLELAERVPNWDKEKADVIVGYSLDAPDHFIQRRIGVCRYQLVASPSYLQQHGIPENPSDLREHRYISHIARRAQNDVSFKAGQSITLNPVAYVNDVGAMIQLAQSGLGIIWVHDYAVSDLVGGGELVPILTNCELPEIPLYIMYPEHRILPPKIRHFVDFVTQKG